MLVSGELAHHSEALTMRLCKHVDVAGIDGRINALPGEVSAPRDGGEKSAEAVVVGGTSRHRKDKGGGLTTHRRAEH